MRTYNGAVIRSTGTKVQDSKALGQIGAQAAQSITRQPRLGQRQEGEGIEPVQAEQWIQAFAQIMVVRSVQLING